MFFKKPEPVSSKDFNLSKEPKYGLPSEVKFCRNCVISNQRPSSTIEFKNKNTEKKATIAFDNNMICSACNVAKDKEVIDWDERKKELKELCDKHRSKDGSYDCLVPGSGGKDSFLQSWILKYEFGMNPLTCTWPPNIYTPWGQRNHRRWIDSGFDNISITPNGLTHRLLTRIALENLLHPFQPFILGQKNLAPKIAAKYDIKLIFYGESGSEYGTPICDVGAEMRGNKYFSKSSDLDLTLGGLTLSELEDFDLTKKDLNQYLPIDLDILDEKKIEVMYLGYYIKWHPQSAYYHAVDKGDFEPSPERTSGTYSKYNSIDDKIDDLHYHTTFIKFGIGRASYDASQEVRSGDLTREEAIALVKKYDGEKPKRFFKEIFQYLSIDSEKFPKASLCFEEPFFDENYYDLLCDKFRSPHLWYLENDKWILKHKIQESKEAIDSLKAWEGNN